LWPANAHAHFLSAVRSIAVNNRNHTIHTGIEREQWCVALHPPGNDFPEEKRVFGTREYAERKAHSMVNAWLRNRSTQMEKTKH
jgi:hypothetical protein